MSRSSAPALESPISGWLLELNIKILLNKKSKEIFIKFTFYKMKGRTYLAGHLKGLVWSLMEEGFKTLKRRGLGQTTVPYILSSQPPMAFLCW